MKSNENLILGDETYQIIGAAMEVHGVLGSGFLELVYHEALMIEFGHRGIPFLYEEPLSIQYKDHELTKRYRADFICFQAVIVEVKAMNEIHSVHASQVLNYLKATNFKVGLLLNFGADKLQYKRFVL